MASQSISNDNYLFLYLSIMKLNQTSGNFEISIPEGIHKAVIYSVVDLGTQTIQSQQYGEQEKKQILISFEIPSITKVFDKEKGEQAVAISKTYTLSLHEKSRLYEVAKSVLGRDLTKEEQENLEPKDLLGGNVTLTVEHNNWYANIKSISKIFDKEKLEAINELRLLELDNIDWDVFNKLHDKLKDKIIKSPEYLQALDKKETSDEVF